MVPSTCSTCAFYHPVTPTQGLCWRYPPVPVGEPFINSLSLVPVCDADQRCGEWKRN